MHVTEKVMKIEFIEGSASYQKVPDYIVHVGESRLTISFFTARLVDTPATITKEWSEMLEFVDSYDPYPSWSAYVPDFLTSVRGVPGFEGEAMFLGCLTLEIGAYGAGEDEWVDYSMFEFLCTEYGQFRPTVIRNRFITTREPKIVWGGRYYKHENAGIIAALCVPFAADKFNDEMTLLLYTGMKAPNAVIGGTYTTVPKPADGSTWMHKYFSAIPNAVPQKNGDAYELEFSLVWPDGRLADKDVTLYAECSSGYLPNRKVEFRSGVGRVKFVPLHLDAGSTVSVKINGRHFTNIGSVEFTV